GAKKHDDRRRAHERGTNAVSHRKYLWRRAGSGRPGPTYGSDLRSGALARGREKALAIQRDGTGVARGAAVLGHAALDLHHITNLHGVAAPALAHQAVRAAHLHRPVRDLARFLVLHVDVEEGVGVHPLDLRDGPRQLEGLV